MLYLLLTWLWCCRDRYIDLLPDIRRLSRVLRISG